MIDTTLQTRGLIQYIRDHPDFEPSNHSDEFCAFLGLDKPPRKPQHGYHPGVGKHFKYYPATDTMEWSDEYID